MIAVESFECSETAAEPIEATEEAIRLMEELGLEGQLSLVKAKSPDKHATRFPYRVITAEERFVYRTLCPAETKIDKYNDGPIPLRVLQIASHAKQFAQCQYVYVWHRANPALKDPVLIGQTHEYSWNSGFQQYILARWGEELETFSVLQKRACDAVRERLNAEANRLINDVQFATDAVLISKGPGYSIQF